MNTRSFTEVAQNARRAKYMLRNLNGLEIIKDLQKTKRYELLPFLMEAFHFAQNPAYGQRFSEIFARAAAEGDTSTCRNIWRTVKVHLNGARICYYYGLYSRGVTPNHPSWLASQFYTKEAYLDGLVVGDHLELLLEAFRTWPQPISNECLRRLQWYAGQACAKRIMTHFGFTQETVREYLDGAACSADATNTLDFLVASLGGWTLGKCYKENLFLYGSAQESGKFFNYFLEHDYMSFTDEERAVMPLDFLPFFGEY